MLHPLLLGLALLITPLAQAGDAGVTATDMVLTVTQMLRKKGVVNKFVEFYGPGLDEMPLADRATIANMAPEYGATMGFFPVDEKTVEYFKGTGRTKAEIEAFEAYQREHAWPWEHQALTRARRYCANALPARNKAGATSAARASANRMKVRFQSRLAAKARPPPSDTWAPTIP